jgi:DNA segregation ATPase FtsK/SpoIIIE-like protein
VQLTSGTLLLRVRDLEDNETYEVDTPNLAFSVLRPGVYRISVDPSSNTTSVSVRSGQGEVTGNGAAYTMRSGDSDIYSGTDSLSVDALPPPQDDALDAWGAERDRRSARDVSAQYVSSDVIGYEDLDEYGSWSTSPQYGNIWYPRQVEAGWAPYHSGHWAYIAPWGYTWVDDKPWGFAPFHYGRWVWAGNAWGWCPAAPRPRFGPYVRPVYAPALVAWVGAGAGVAWFALGPREVYVPSYHVSPGYVRNINISNTTVNRTVINNVYNTTIINNKTVNVTYINRGAPGAVAATSAQAFASAQPVQRNRFAFDQQAMRGAPVRVAAPTVVPTREAVIGSNRESVRPPPQLRDRPVIARTAPPPPPVAVDRRIEALRGNGGRPLSQAEVRRIQPSGPAARPAPIHVAPVVEPVAVANAPLRRPPANVANNSAQNAPTNGPRERFSTSMPVNRPAPSAVHATELPATPRPPSPANAESALQRQQMQQQQQLRAQQDQERLRVQQQQELQHQQAARQQAAQEMERQHQAQAQQQQQRAQQEEAARRAQQQELVRQQSERQQAENVRAADMERQHQLQTQQMQQRQIAQQQELQRRQQQMQQQAQQQREAAQQQQQKRPAKPEENKRPP